MVHISLINDEHYNLGDEIIVTIRCLNDNIDRVPINIPVTSSGKLKHDLFIVERQIPGTMLAEKVEHHGMNMKVKNEVNFLPFQQAFEFPVKIGREYFINEKGSYNLTLDSMAISPYDPMIISQLVTIYEIGEQPVTTWLQQAVKQRKGVSNDYKKFGTHYVYSSTSSQFIDLQQAHEKAIQSLNIIKMHSDLTSDMHKHYGTMFCLSNTDKWDQIFEKYSNINHYLQDAMKYRFNGDFCDQTSYAYVLSHDPDKNIYLCDLYDKATIYPTRQNQYDTKVGTILHEVSHKAVDSKDHFYSHQECRNNAKVCNDLDTTTNADCLQIFAELTFLTSAMGVTIDEL